MPAPTSQPQFKEIEHQALRKASLRLIPLIALGYCVAYMDRVNISFAALQMNRDLHFSETTYGFGAGLFFLSYALVEIPSNLLLYRFGARRWLSRIMVSWGILAACMLLIRTPLHFYTMRLLLGAAEAGFFPGVVFYLMQWFPPEWRARTVTRFYIALPLSSTVMGALAGALLHLQGRGGLAGWQWLFLVEGLPAVLLGVVFFLLLPDGPTQASWLTPDERQAILNRLETPAGSAMAGSLVDALRDRRVWLFATFSFLNLVSLYAYTFSAPAILQSATHLGASRVGFLIAATGLLGAAAMLLGGIYSDRTLNRHGVIIPAALLMSAGFLLCGWTSSAPLVVVSFALIVIGFNGMQGPLWSLPASYIQGRAAAVGFALIGAIGVTGGFIGPYWMGFMRDLTGSYQRGLMTMALPMLLGAAIMLYLRRLLPNHLTQSADFGASAPGNE